MTTMTSSSTQQTAERIAVAIVREIIPTMDSISPLARDLCAAATDTRDAKECVTAAALRPDYDTGVAGEICIHASAMLDYLISGQPDVAMTIASEIVDQVAERARSKAMALVHPDDGMTDADRADAAAAAVEAVRGKARDIWRAAGA